MAWQVPGHSSASAAALCAGGMQGLGACPCSLLGTLSLKNSGSLWPTRLAREGKEIALLGTFCFKDWAQKSLCDGTFIYYNWCVLISTMFALAPLLSVILHKRAEVMNHTCSVLAPFC